MSGDLHPAQAMPPVPALTIVYLLYDQDQVVSVHASVAGADAARASYVARAKAELCDQGLEHFVDAQVAIAARPMGP